MQNALDQSDGSMKTRALCPEVEEAIEWLSVRTEQQIVDERERAISQLEEMGKQMRAEGAVDRWFLGSVDTVRRGAQDVNGPLCDHVADTLLQYHDRDCIDFFRKGAPLIGLLPISGNGVAMSSGVHESLSELRAKADERNRENMASLREDCHAAAILEKTRKDAMVGRMSVPTVLEDSNLPAVAVLAPRFAVVQGVDAEGMPKLRVVDDGSICGVNGASEPQERLVHDTVDLLYSAAQRFVVKVQAAPTLMKADIDAAFRRIPIAPEHYFAAFVMFMALGRVYVAKHHAMPFGALSSVHAWDRVGSFLLSAARRILKIPMLRYVDDYFAVDKDGCAEHGLDCFVRLVRCLLGDGAIAKEKISHGVPLTILGLDIMPSMDGFACWPRPEKVEKWVRRIDTALQTNRLCSGEASKLAGALGWAAQNMFRRIGRAMLRPLYNQARRRRAAINKPLTLCLNWWKEVCIELVNCV